MIRALLWDVDGTLAETERDGHRPAFNAAFESMGLPWRWDAVRYGELLAVAGGRERILADMATHADAPAPAEREALARELHRRKNLAYAEIVAAGGVVLRDGVMPLLQQAQAAGLAQAIATTTSRANVQALLSRALGKGWASWFAAVVCGEDVQAKKPHPEVFLRALAHLKRSPRECLALEDSPAGAQAARAAELPVVVTRSAYFSASPIAQALAIGPGLHRRDGWQPALEAGTLGGVGLADLRAWHQGMAWVAQA